MSPKEEGVNENFLILKLVNFSLKGNKNVEAGVLMKFMVERRPTLILVLYLSLPYRNFYILYFLHILNILLNFNYNVVLFS